MDSKDSNEDFSKLSIEERVTHKNWKARVSGYTDLAKLFPTFEAKEFQKFSPLIKNFAVDSNAAAQEKALVAVLAYVDYCPQAGKYLESIVAGVANKCLASTRAKTKEIAADIVLMCVEIEFQDVVVQELVKALDQKTPKNVAATISMIRRCLNQFGYKVISVKPIVPTLAKLLEDRDPNVREEAKQLTIEIYRWVKDALLPQLSSLKPIRLQELTAEFEKVKEVRPVPERLLRSQQQRADDEVDGAPGGDGNVDEVVNGGGMVEENVDPFELMEPFDVIASLPSDFSTLIEAKKWQERKDGLEKLHQLLEANPKLATNSDYNELMKQIKKIVAKDSNIIVATLAIKCLHLLAAGLRKNFHNYAGSCTTLLLEKFKEKKANVVQALREAIDSVYISTTLEAIVEDVTTALDNKNPSIRSETALFLARCFAKTNPHTVNKKLLQSLTTSLLKTLSDSDSTVRESSAEALGTLLKAQGDRNMGPFLQGLENLKMAKIEEYRAKVEVKKFPMAPQPAPPASKPQTKKAPARGAPKTVTPVPTASSSMESLNDLPAPAAKSEKKPTASSAKFGQVKSRLGTVTRRTPGSSSSRLANSAKASISTGTASGGSATGGTSGGGSSKKQDDPAASAPMMVGNVRTKDQRFADEKALKVLKWNFTSPREEFYLQLREQMTSADWNQQLVSFCFHSDFKYHIKAIDMMREFFQKNSNDSDLVVANLDLILKWVALRFFDTNPSVIMKALELLLVLFQLCETHSYSMTDFEANSFFPYLVLKVGDPKDVVRNKVHEILIRTRNLYPANKIFAHLLGGLQSKNSRQRATCLEEIALLIELKGMSIFQPPNSLQVVKEIARFIAERDNAVRNGALSCIVQVYFLEGEKVFKLVGSLSDKEMSLVEERIKRASKNKPVPPPVLSDTNNKTSKSAASESNQMSGLPAPSTTSSNSKLQTLYKGSNSARSFNGRSDHHSTPQMSHAGFSKLNSLSSGRLINNEHQAGGQYDIGATFSKSKSTNMLLKQRFSQQHSDNGCGEGDIDVDDNHEMNDNRSNSNGKNGNSPRLMMNTNNSHTSGSESATTGCDDLFTESDDELNQKVKQALNLPELKLPKRNYSRYSTPGHEENGMMSGGGTPTSNNEAALINRKISQLFTQLSSTEIQQAFEALEDFNVLLKDHAKFAPFLHNKVDQLIYLCNKQLRLFLNKHYPSIGAVISTESANGQPAENEADVQSRQKKAELLFRGIVSVLSKLFNCPLGKKVSRDTLRELFTHLLPYLPEMKDNKNVFNAVNYLLSVMMNGSDVTNLFSALIRMLHDYVGNPTGQSAHLDKYLEFTMKFMWRASKLLDRYIGDLNLDVILYESHLFFNSYPRSWWKNNNREDLPFRTIKTLIYLIVEQKGDTILSHFTLIQNKDESELSYYIQKALRQCELHDKKNSSTASKISANSLESAGSSTPSVNSHHTPLSVKQQRSSFNNDGISTPLSKENIDGEQRTPVGGGGGVRGASQTPPTKLRQPRTSLADFPLKTRQINFDNQTRTVPVIQTEEELKTYVDYTAKQLDIPFSYQQLCDQQKNFTRIKSVEEAQRAVNQAQERLSKFKNFLNGLSCENESSSPRGALVSDNDTNNDL